MAEKEMNEEMRMANFQRLYNEVGTVKADNTRTLGYWYYRDYKKIYSSEEIERILDTGDLKTRKELSQHYFNKDGIYKRLIIYYATLLNYYGILIPQVMKTKNVKEKAIQSKYDQVLNFLSYANIPDMCANWALKVLRDGTYYGVVTNITNEGIVIIDLPSNYCESNYVDLNGNDMIEFNVQYFDSIIDDDLRKSVLSNYPKFIQKGYRRYKKGKGKYKILIPSNIGVCFSLFDSQPLFLNIIPTIEQYKDAVDIEQERDMEEIKKIIVQKVPHLGSTGDLVFEPDEALEMHKGAVNMMKDNHNVNVLTTYADVDSIVSRSNTDSDRNLEKMLNNIYSAGGVSGQLFALAGASSLKYSMDKDLALMMLLANKFSNCISNLINTQFGDNKVKFTYNILPVAEYNKSSYVEDSLKMANSGYSFLLPAAAMGINQKDLITLKTLENDVLEMGELLIPLSTSFTQSSNEGAGRPALADEDKSSKTIQNEESINNQGGVSGE